MGPGVQRNRKCRVDVVVTGGCVVKENFSTVRITEVVRSPRQRVVGVASVQIFSIQNKYSRRLVRGHVYPCVNRELDKVEICVRQNANAVGRIAVEAED